MFIKNAKQSHTIGSRQKCCWHWWLFDDIVTADVKNEKEIGVEGRWDNVSCWSGSTVDGDGDVVIGVDVDYDGDGNGDGDDDDDGDGAGDIVGVVVDDVG